MYPRFYKLLKSKSFFLFGPRGTGKTTWLKAQLPDAQVVNLLDADTARTLLASAARLEGMIPKETEWVVIDEIQRAPALLDEVHRLIEKKIGLKFALTGSSARKLRRGAANLLAGRAIQRFMYPLTLWELGGDFKLPHALEFGLLPNAWTDEQPREFLATYVYTYLKEEVFAEGLTRNLEAFSRFLEVMSFSQGQPLNQASIAKDVGVDPKVIAHSIEILEDLLLASRVPVFKRRARRRMTSHSKFFFFDVGVFRALRPKGPLDLTSELEGPALETLFFHHHRALGEMCRWDQQLYFWRSASGQEVDFVSYGSLGLFGFEVQRNSIVLEDNLKALRLFAADYPVAKKFLLYGGTRTYHQNGVSIIPFEEAVRRLPELMGVSFSEDQAHP